MRGDEILQWNMPSEKTDKIRRTKKFRVIKNILFGIGCMIIFLGAVAIGITYRMNSIKELGYTKYNLSASQLNGLLGIYGIYTEEYVSAWGFEDKYMYYVDKDKMVLFASEYSQIQVDKLNEMLQTPEASRGREKAAEYGITEENPMTVEWVMKHPKEALEIVYSDEDLWELDSVAITYAIRNQYN